MMDFRKMPKIDLHRHMDGDINPKVLLEIARKDKVDLPYKNPADLEQFFKSLLQKGLADLFVDGFGLTTSLSQTAENLELIAFEEVRNLKKDGIIYAELRFAPQYHCQGEQAYYRQLNVKSEKLSYREVVAAVAKGLKRGFQEFGVPTNLIVCIGREIEPKKGVEIAEVAIKSHDLGVVAIDLACDEANFSALRHADAYKLTFGSKIKRTIHAGESGTQKAQNMYAAIECLQADRIGHAIPLVDMPKLTEMIIRREIGVEMCPLSNLITGAIDCLGELGIDELLKQKVLVTINSDDPRMFGYTLSDSFLYISRFYRFGKKEIRTLLLNAVQTAFCNADMKQTLEKNILKYF